MSAAVPFMAAAVLLLPLIGIGLALIAGLLTSGNYRAFPVLAVNHLVTLGWGTLIAMGALHQMFPAMIGAPLRPGREAVAQFVLSFSGMAALVTGFWLRSTGLIAAGGAVVWSGLMWFLWLILRVIPYRRRWSLPLTGVALALLYLALAVTWGLLMGLNWRWGFWRGLLGYAGVGTHVALGVGGWFVQLILSVSYYLVPRFTGAEHDDERRLRPVLILLNAGIAAFVGAALGVSAPLNRLGAALLAAAGLVYAGDLAGMLRGTRRMKPDLTIHHWWAVWAYTVVLSVLGIAWAAGVLALDGRRVSAVVVLLLLIGWVTAAIMGQLYKVTPFLMWYYRYARGLSAFEVPRLAAPYYPAAGIPPFWLTLSGVALLGLGVLVPLPAVGLFGSLAFLAGALAFCFLMAISWIRATVGTR